MTSSSAARHLAAVRILDSPVVCDALVGRFTQPVRDELLIVHHDRLVLYDVAQEVPERISNHDLYFPIRAATVLRRHDRHGSDVLVLISEKEVMCMLTYEDHEFVQRVVSHVEKDRGLHTSGLVAASDGSSFCRTTYEGVRTIFGLAEDAQYSLERRLRQEVSGFSRSCFFAAAHGGALVTHLPCSSTSGSIEKLTWHGGEVNAEERHTCPTAADLCSPQIVLTAGAWMLLIGSSTFTALRSAQIDSGDVAGTQTTQLPATWKPVTAADCTEDMLLLAEGCTLRILSLDNGSIRTRAKLVLDIAPSMVRILGSGKSAFVADDQGRSVVVALRTEPHMVAADSGPATLLDAQKSPHGLYTTGGSKGQGHLTLLRYGYEILSSVQVDLGQSIDAATAVFAVNTYLVDESAYILVSFPWQSLLLSCTIDEVAELDLAYASFEFGIRNDVATLYFGELEQGMVQVCRDVIVHIAPGHQIRTKEVDAEVLLATGTKSMLILACRRQESCSIETLGWVKAEASQTTADDYLYQLADPIQCSGEPTAMTLIASKGVIHLAVSTGHDVRLFQFSGSNWTCNELHFRRPPMREDMASATQRLVGAPFRSVSARRSTDGIHVLAIRQDESVEEASSGSTWPSGDGQRYRASASLSNNSGTDADMFTISDGSVYCLRGDDAALDGHLPLCGADLRARGGIIIDSPFCPSTQIIRPTGLLTWYGSQLSFTTVAKEPSYTRVTSGLSSRGRRVHVDSEAGLVCVGLDDGDRPDLVACDAASLRPLSAQPAQSRKRKSTKDTTSILAPLFKPGETLYGLVPWTIRIKQDVLSCLVICLATKANELGERGGRLMIVQIKRQGEQVRFKRLLSRLFDAPILAALATGGASSTEDVAMSDADQVDDQADRLLVSHNYKLEEFILDPATLKLVSGRISAAPFRSHVVELRHATDRSTEAYIALTQLDGFHIVGADLQCRQKSSRNALATSCIALNNHSILTADKLKYVWLETLDGTAEPRIVVRLPSVATRLIYAGSDDQGRRTIACCCLDGSVHLLFEEPAFPTGHEALGDAEWAMAGFALAGEGREPESLLVPAGSRSNLLKALHDRLRPLLAVHRRQGMDTVDEVGIERARQVWQALHSL